MSKYGVLWLSKFILEVAISYQNILSNLSPRMPHTPVFHFAILHARPTRRSLGAISHSITSTLIFIKTLQICKSGIVQTKCMLNAIFQIHGYLFPRLKAKISLFQYYLVFMTVQTLDEMSDIRFKINQLVYIVIDLIFQLHDLNNGIFDLRLAL